MGIISKAVVGYAVGVATTQGENARDKRLNFNDKLSATLSRITGYVGTQFEVAANGSSFIGLNYQKVEPIRTAIREYVKSVQDVLSELNTEATTKNALKGDIAVSAAKYVKAVSDVANAYVSALLAYSDKMYDYGMQIAANDQTLKKEVDDEANALTSDAEAYTEQHKDVFKAPVTGDTGAGVAAGAAAGAAAAASAVK